MLSVQYYLLYNRKRKSTKNLLKDLIIIPQGLRSIQIVANFIFIR